LFLGIISTSIDFSRFANSQSEIKPAVYIFYPFLYAQLLSPYYVPFCTEEEEIAKAVNSVDAMLIQVKRLDTDSFDHFGFIEEILGEVTEQIQSVLKGQEAYSC
jgi:hypothetical protein